VNSTCFNELVNFNWKDLIKTYKLYLISKIMKAILLAAGEGKRMRPLTLETPKPMIDVLGKPLLHHLIDGLPSEITVLIIVIGYKGEQIRAYFGESFEGRKVSYVIQEKQIGNAQALELCQPLLSK
jgi:NDP-sugar pyrophosphorylase family protein